MADIGRAQQLSVGVDIAADTFTASWLASGGTPTTPCTYHQTPAGYAALRKRLHTTAVSPAETLVALEARGNSWVALAVAWHEAGDRVAVSTPRQAHHCATAQLRRAKTDALDAQDLAQFAARLHPAPWTRRRRSTMKCDSAWWLLGPSATGSWHSRCEIANRMGRMAK